MMTMTRLRQEILKRLKEICDDRPPTKLDVDQVMTEFHNRLIAAYSNELMESFGPR